MIFGVVIDRLLLKSPLADAPQVYRYTLLITELGTEIIALTLHYRFYCAMIVTNSAIELYEICLPHTYILCSFALFVYPFPLFRKYTIGNTPPNKRLIAVLQAAPPMPAEKI